MKLFTSCYHTAQSRPEIHDRLVSISVKDPRWYQGRRFPILAPFELYRCNDYELFVREYHERVLSHLDPARIAERLGDGSIMLCWEKLVSKGEWCHRQIVAEWLRTAGIEVEEMENAKRKDDAFQGFSQLGLF